MPVEIRVPQLGESVVEATVIRWLKKPGDPVSAGEAVVELETDKVNVEVAAEEAGVLQQVVKSEGDTVAVGSVLGTIGVSAQAAAPVQPAAAGRVEEAPGGDGRAAATRNGGQPNGAMRPADAFATPVARRVAEENEIDLSDVHGTGPGGRITKDDVAVQISRAAEPPAPAPQPQAPPPAAVAPPRPAAPQVAPVILSQPAGERREERRPMSRRRQTIAARLVEAQRTAAMLTTFNEVDMTAVMEIRKRRKDSFKERHGVGLGFMSFFTKATVGALKSFPLLNAEIQGSEIVIKHYYDMGIAVSTEEGLVVPVVRDADRLSFAGIERKIGELAVKAREGKLTLPELLGGTFTITNGGVFGSLMSTPILNAPQVGILGLHKIEERPMAVAGQVVIRPMMYLALSYDHRIVDGSEAVRFLVRIKELIEDPEQLLLEG